MNEEYIKRAAQIMFKMAKKYTADEDRDIRWMGYGLENANLILQDAIEGNWEALNWYEIGIS